MSVFGRLAVPAPGTLLRRPPVARALPLVGRGPSLAGRRVLITGGTRGIGAALARRLHAEGAQVALIGRNEELLAKVAADCGGAPWRRADVCEQDSIGPAVDELAEALGGLDVVVANAGVAKQLPVIGGDPAIIEEQLRTNVLGVYLTLQAGGPHIARPGGYAVVICSLAAALNVPLTGGYASSKAAAEVLANTFRGELIHTGARVGTAYLAEMKTDMTERGFRTRAASTIQRMSPTKVSTVDVAVDALERGIARRSRLVFAPGWVGPLVAGRMFAQPVVERVFQPRIREALAAARQEQPAPVAGR